MHLRSVRDETEDDPPRFRRVSGSEPARVASDTRKGVAMLQQLEALRKHAASASD